MSRIQIANLQFSHGAQSILKDLSFSVEEGELLSILGASGSGKTTLLRVLAGFETLQEGDIQFFGSQGRPEALNRGRDMGFVFQDFALFDHLSVQENVEYGCTSEEDFRRSEELMTLLQIQGLKSRKPESLSGGEKQRVALARALALSPKLLLMDEPFSSIDRDRTQQLIEDFRDIFKALKVTVIMVTHSLDEAIQFANRILFLKDGEIQKDGPIESFYGSDVSPSVRKFFGDALWVRGICSKSGFQCEAGSLNTQGLEFSGPGKLMLRIPRRPVVLPDDIG